MKLIRYWYINLIIIILGFALLEGAQILIGQRTPPTCNIIDRLHILTDGWNHYFHLHTKITNFILITTSLWFDLSCLFLAFVSFLGPSIRPFLSFLIALLLRQFVQLLVSLPIPAGIIWYYPGFPSLFVDYATQGDLFFSAHTCVALICAIELARFKKTWLTVMGYLFFVYLVSMVIVFRAHYTIDVFTALFVVFFANSVSKKLSSNLNTVFLNSKLSL